MEGTTPNPSEKSIDDLIKDMESRLGELTMGMLEIKEKQEEDFTGEGIDITDSLPTIDEALFLKKENDKLKEDSGRDSILIAQGEHKLKIKTQYIMSLEQERGKMKEENEKLKEEIEKLKEKKVASHTQDELPFPEPPLGAPHLWKNAICTGCSQAHGEECGFAHSMEEALYYQKRLLRKDIKSLEETNKFKKEIKELKSKIPANHHKRLSPYDKQLLTSIKHDVISLEECGDYDDANRHYPEKKKLLVRLLK
jgi:hypothetical protein